MWVVAVCQPADGRNAVQDSESRWWDITEVAREVAYGVLGRTETGTLCQQSTCDMVRRDGCARGGEPFQCSAQRRPMQHVYFSPSLEIVGGGEDARPLDQFLERRDGEGRRSNSEGKRLQNVDSEVRRLWWEGTYGRQSSKKAIKHKRVKFCYTKHVFLKRKRTNFPKNAYSQPWPRAKGCGPTCWAGAQQARLECQGGLPWGQQSRVMTLDRT